LRELRFDVALIGLSGWDEDGAPMDFDLEKIAVKRIAVARARQSLALCDAGKFERAAVARILAADAFAAVVTDRAPPPPLAQKPKQDGVDLVIADA